MVFEAASQFESGEVTLKDAEAAVSRAIATQSALKPDSSSKSWWPNLSLWSKETNTADGKSYDAPHTKDKGL